MSGWGGWSNSCSTSRGWRRRACRSSADVRRSALCSDAVREEALLHRAGRGRGRASRASRPASRSTADQERIHQVRHQPGRERRPLLTAGGEPVARWRPDAVGEVGPARGRSTRGPGIPESERGAGVRALPPPRRVALDGGGAGLGLAIARWIVDLHGGSIRIEDAPPPSGCRFVVEAPRGRSG